MQTVLLLMLMTKVGDKITVAGILSPLLVLLRRSSLL